MTRFQKKAQMEIPFQLIFSLILIAAFIFAAIAGIRYFLATADHAKINSFIADIQSDVNSAWLSSGFSQTYEFSLPSRVSFVCFSSGELTSRQIDSLSSECREFSAYLLAYNGKKQMNMFFCSPSKVSAVDAPVYARIDCSGKDCLMPVKTPYCINNTKGTVKIKLEKQSGAAEVMLS